MDYLLLGVYACALVIGILGPVLVLCLYRNLRGCARYRQVPWSSCPRPLPLQELERLCQVQTGTLVLGPVLVLCLYRN
jgi:hypothetical protein